MHKTPGRRLTPRVPRTRHSSLSPVYLGALDRQPRRRRWTRRDSSTTTRSSTRKRRISNLTGKGQSDGGCSCVKHAEERGWHSNRLFCCCVFPSPTQAASHDERAGWCQRSRILLLLLVAAAKSLQTNVLFNCFLGQVLQNSQVLRTQTRPVGRAAYSIHLLQVGVYVGVPGGEHVDRGPNLDDVPALGQEGEVQVPHLGRGGVGKGLAVVRQASEEEEW